MNPYSVIVGSHIQLFRQGDPFTVPGPGGVCDINAKPDPTDAGWIDIGAIEDVEPSVSQSDHKLFKPAPGRLVLKDVKETQQEMSLKVTTNEVSSLAFETLFRTSQKLSGAQKQFNPLSAVSRYFWLHCQVYDDTDTLILTWDQWCKVRSKQKWAKEPVMPEWEIFCLYSQYNTGLLGA